MEINSESILERLGDDLFQILTPEPVYFTSGKRQINVRCRFCGDSEKNHRHAHMYIGNSKNTGILSYYCQRCNVEGIVSNNFLSMYDVNDFSLKADIINLNKQFMKSRGYSSNNATSSFIKKYHNYDFTVGGRFNVFVDKIEYIENRLGYGFINNESLTTYKIIFSLYDFLQKNNIDLSKSMSQQKLDVLLPMLETSYVGFLNDSGCNIVFRNINPFEKQRYFKLSLEPIVQTEFYSIKSKIDISQKVTINMTEGTFDIIRLQKYNFVSDKDINIAVLNKDYINKVKDIIKRVGSLELVERINIFSDDKIHYNFYKKQFSSIRHIFDTKVRIYKNATGKDYGDIAEPVILERKIK